MENGYTADVKEETRMTKRWRSVAGTLGRADKRYQRIAQTLVQTPVAIGGFICCAAHVTEQKQERAFVICAARRVAV